MSKDRQTDIFSFEESPKEPIRAKKPKRDKRAEYEALMAEKRAHETIIATPAIVVKPAGKSDQNLPKETNESSKTGETENGPSSQDNRGSASAQRKPGSSRGNRSDRAIGSLFDTIGSGNSTFDGGTGGEASGRESVGEHGVSTTITTSGNAETRSAGVGAGSTNKLTAAYSGVSAASTASDKFQGAVKITKPQKPKSTDQSASPLQDAFDLSVPISSNAPVHKKPESDLEKTETSNSLPENKSTAPNYRYTEGFDIGQGGAKAKAKNNIAAIKLVKDLIAEEREADPDTQKILANFVGWGGLPQIFDETKADWGSLYKELKELLTEEEYEAARFSTINAHYTSRDVVEAMWEGAQGLGFTSGRVLEPGMGVGYFMGLSPEDMQGKLKLTGVELDKMTGQIARALYPQAEIRIEGFETTNMPTNNFDMAIGNVPFGNVVLRDPVHNRGKHSIHDHFINKSIDLLKPGGISAFVTSRFTLDKMNPAARKELENKADLIGAIRLPNNTFAGNAGTAVVTDILVFRKRKDGEEPQEQEWVKTAEFDLGDSQDRTARINQYFIDNPDMMLGKIEYGQGMYSDEELRWIMDETVPIRSQIELAFQKIIDHAQLHNLTSDPQDVSNTPQAQSMAEIIVDADIEDGSYYLNTGGDIYQLSQSRGVLVREKPKKDEATPAQRRDYDIMKRMIELRDCARKLLSMQMQEWDEEGHPPWEKQQKKLNDLYDEFVAKHGYINSISKRRIRAGASGEERFSITRKYLKLFKGDPAVNFVRALEVFNTETETAVKTDIFKNRVVSPDRTITGVENAKDGLLASLNTKGRVDLGYIADLTGINQQDVIKELDGLIFRNPENEQWETENEYLSGNVRAKLETAQKASNGNPSYTRNVAALEQVIPQDLSPQDIDVAFGAPWLPPEIIEQFVHETIEIEEQYKDSLSVHFYPEQALWRVKGASYKLTADPKVNVEWGTSRKPMLEIISDMLNQKNIDVYDTVEDNKKVKNVKETIAAKEKQQKIIDRFREWVWEDEDRAERLARIYNDRYNNIRLRQYDGSHLSLPGLNNTIKLRDHQKNVIWRILQSGNTLMGHAVGAGKTLAAIGASMEEKRLGLTNKPLHVVPNHMLDQYAQDFQKAYPDAKILVADKEDFVGEKRRDFIAQCATGNWDAVIMTHSSFGKVGVSQEREASFLKQRIDEYTTMIDKAKSDGDRFTVKIFEKMKKNREEKIQSLLKSEGKDKGITFEEMGVDRLYIDEAHLFKNLEFTTRTKGVSQASSQRAMDLFMKIGYLEEFNPGRSAVFMTGTPIANSVAEAYTMMRYLYLDKMKEAEIDNFDSWIAMFGEFVTALELAPDGGSYRMHSRLAKFCNVPELKQMFLEFADIMTADMLDLPKPKLKGGKHTVITVPASDELQDYIQDLVKRAEAVKNREVEPHVDNMLKITSDGRKAALDLREMGIDVVDADQEGLKLKRAAQEIAQRYHDNKDNEYVNEAGEVEGVNGALQSVFCDLSTPGKYKDFSAYDKLRDYLIDLGVPAEEIRFIHEYNDDKKKAQFFEECRNGKVSVVMGSTSKMGFGTNIQKRMVAQHHLDAPWRPADIEQRDGRIERQGNQNEEIEILRYVTEGSFDVYMWQALERKAKFIAQLMSPLGTTSRSFEDNDVKSLSYAEVKAIATGDTRLIEQAENEAKLAKLSSLRDSHNKEQWRLKAEIKSHYSFIEMHKSDIENIGTTMDTIRFDEKFTVDGFTTDDAKGAGVHAMKKIRKQFEVSNVHSAGYQKQEVGQVYGFPIIVETGGKIGSETTRITVRSPYEIQISYYEEELKKLRADTVLNKLVREFEKLADYTQNAEDRIAGYQSQISKKSGYIGQDFDREEEYKALRSRQKELEESLRPTDTEVETEERVDVEEVIAATLDTTKPDSVDFHADV